MNIVFVMAVLTAAWLAALTLYRRRLPDMAVNMLFAAPIPLMIGWYFAFIDWCRATGNCP